MARGKIDRTEALKNFVTELKAKYPNAKSYDRATVEEIGKNNPAGFTAFASAANGYGKMTRMGHGMYVIPANWETNAPWTVAVSQSTSTSASA